MKKKEKAKPKKKPTLAELLAKIERLEQRIALLESRPAFTPPTPPPPPPVDAPIPIARVSAENGDGPAIIHTEPPHGWQTGVIVLIHALMQNGPIQLQHPYAITVVSDHSFNISEEDVDPGTFIFWNDAALGNGANPGSCSERVTIVNP